MPPKVVCIVGPTGCGKTRTGVMLAKELGGEVVSCDSMQIYRGMTVGTAAPTPEEMEGIPHHMVAVADPSEEYSAARYAAEATECVDRILTRGKLPIIVGGTGLYLEALVHGRQFAAGHAGGEIRRRLYERLESEGIETLLAELAAVDPESAERLHPNDQKRILRALEVWQETGETITRHNAASQELPPRYETVKIGLAYANREHMKAAIDRRVDEMMTHGLLQEAERLMKSGIRPDATALQAIGYKECMDYLAGRCTVEEAAERIKLRSRQYAKRQLTWLRRDKEIRWFYWQEDRDFAAALHFSTRLIGVNGVS